MSAPLIVERHDGGVMLTLDRPDKRNALSGELVEALIEAVDAAHAEGVEVLVLRGEGQNFSAGFDFSGWKHASEGDLALRFVRIEMLLDKIARSPAVTIACAHGRNFGAGVDLFGACKRRIAEDDATFRMPGLNFGLVLGTRRFAACVGRDAAREIQASTRTFDASEARELGFVTQIASQNEWPALFETEFERTPDATRAVLHGALDDDHSDRDLAQLARSAAAPGLKERIAAYLAPRD